MQIPASTSKMFAVFLAYLAAETQAYPMQGWPMYAHAPSEYPEEDYYSPKSQYYYDSPAVPASEIYGQVHYPYISEPYGNFEPPKGHEERIAALPVGQEIWYQNESPRWQNNDVNAAFLDNLILTQMAQDAQRRRENAHAAFPSSDYETEETERDAEDEDVRELKALAGKPLYHVPKTAPRLDDEEDYASDEPEDSDSFINWNGNKRSIITTAAAPTNKPKAGQQEVLLPGPGQTHKTLQILQEKQHKRTPNHVFYNTVSQLLENKAKNIHEQEESKARKIEKRFVSSDRDLVFELRGLKRRIAT